MQYEDFTIWELSKRLGCSRQALYLAINKGKLKAIRKNKRWVISLKDIINYKKTRYDRINMTDEEGNKVYDHSKHIYSVSQLSALTGVSVARIYYLIRTNVVPFEKYRSQYVIKGHSLDEIVKYVTHSNRRKKK